jgi:hypothetical protein
MASVRLSGRILEPVERISEILFGLIMALTITGAVSVTTADHLQIQTMLIAALGCNLAWGSMPHDFSLWERGEVFSPEQQDRILTFKNNIWDATVAACPQTGFRPACSLALPALTSLFEVARLRAGASEKHPPQIIYAMLFGLGLGGRCLPASAWLRRRRVAGFTW